MAKKRHDWNALKKQYFKDLDEGKIKTLKEFAENNNLSYNTLRRHSTTWNREKELIEDTFQDTIVAETIEDDALTPKDRNLLHIRLWDKLLNITAKALDNPDFYLCDNEGKIKTRDLERVANMIDKAQKGQRLALRMDKESKENTGLLDDITDAINIARDKYK